MLFGHSGKCPAIICSIRLTAAEILKVRVRKRRVSWAAHDRVAWLCSKPETPFGVDFVSFFIYIFSFSFLSRILFMHAIKLLYKETREKKQKVFKRKFSQQQKPWASVPS